MTKFLLKFWQDEAGISSVEYAVLLAFIAGGVAIAASELGIAVGDRISDAATCVETAQVADCGAAAPAP